MQFNPKKIFVIENGEYIEITYQEFAARYKANDSYLKQRFICIDGIILEMPQDKRKEFYKDKRRQKYQRECERKFGVFSYDSLTTDEFNGEEIVADSSACVSDTAIDKTLLEKLNECLMLLPEDEYELLQKYFYQNLSQEEIARDYCVNQSTISRRIDEILCKLRNLLKN